MWSINCCQSFGVPLFNVSRSISLLEYSHLTLDLPQFMGTSPIQAKALVWQQLQSRHQCNLRYNRYSDETTNWLIISDQSIISDHDVTSYRGYQGSQRLPILRHGVNKLGHYICNYMLHFIAVYNIQWTICLCRSTESYMYVLLLSIIL